MQTIAATQKHRVKRPAAGLASASEVDEALWAAYRKYERSRVTQYLLDRFLTPAPVR